MRAWACTRSACVCSTEGRLSPQLGQLDRVVEAVMSVAAMELGSLSAVVVVVRVVVLVSGEVIVTTIVDDMASSRAGVVGENRVSRGGIEMIVLFVARGQDEGGRKRWPLVLSIRVTTLWLLQGSMRFVMLAKRDSKMERDQKQRQVESFCLFFVGIRRSD